jgi:hypothetical protein
VAKKLLRQHHHLLNMLFLLEAAGAAKVVPRVAAGVVQAGI